MTNEEEIIKSTFKEYYWDLGVYRLVNRNKKEIKMFFGLSFIGVFIFALMGLYPPLIVWSVLFISSIWVVGVDHFIIGLRFKKILNELENKNIKINLKKLLLVCEEILPN